MFIHFDTLVRLSSIRHPNSIRIPVRVPHPSMHTKHPGYPWASYSITDPKPKLVSVPQADSTVSTVNSASWRAGRNVLFQLGTLSRAPLYPELTDLEGKERVDLGSHDSGVNPTILRLICNSQAFKNIRDQISYVYILHRRPKPPLSSACVTC